MKCYSPEIDIGVADMDSENPEKLEYGFKMDNVAGVQNLTRFPNVSPFLLYPNPVYDKFDEEVKYYKSDYLTINVSWSVLYDMLSVCFTK